MKVLIVDDEPGVRDLLSAAIGIVGYEQLDLAEDGEKALALTLTNRCQRCRSRHSETFSFRPDPRTRPTRPRSRTNPNSHSRPKRQGDQCVKQTSLALLIFLTSFSLRAENTFEDVHLLERNKERIKATGDLRAKFKLMKVVVQFRDNDLLISGNDYRYDYITVIPYSEIQSLTFSDIDGDLPREMRESAPLYRDILSGRDQRWFQIRYDQNEILLMLSKESDSFIRSIQTHTGKSITLSVDGLSRLLDDVTFRQCRVVQTITDRKGKTKTDDYACLIIMSKSNITIKGKDKNYDGQIDIPYTQIQSLAYEHARQSSYMGRMPGFGAFRKAKHWFVIKDNEHGHIPLLLDAGDVADFREAIKTKSGIPINTQVPGIARSQPATLPDQFDIQTPAKTTKLTSAQTIRCTLGPGQRANWDSQSLNRDSNARFADSAPQIIFENIDISAQTAQMRTGKKTYPTRVVASGQGLTFITITGNETQITSIFVQNKQLISIHSHHTGGKSPHAGQFYGVAEILK